MSPVQCIREPLGLFPQSLLPLSTTGAGIRMAQPASRPRATPLRPADPSTPTSLSTCSFREVKDTPSRSRRPRPRHRLPKEGLCGGERAAVPSGHPPGSWGYPRPPPTMLRGREVEVSPLSLRPGRGRATRAGTAPGGAEEGGEEESPLNGRLEARELPKEPPAYSCGYGFRGAPSLPTPQGGGGQPRHPPLGHTAPTCTPVPTGSARSTRKARSPSVEVTLT